MNLKPYSRELFAAQSKQPVSAWCESALSLPPGKSESPGPLSWLGRDYMREPLDAWNAPGVTDLVLCFGSQTGKSTLMIAGVAYVLVNSPSGLLWVHPTQQLARSFSTTRWLPVVKVSPSLTTLMPTGSAKRTGMTLLQQEFGPSLVNFVGSNSPANLASRPARVVIMDEVDKFPKEVRSEADAVNLAEQRTKSFTNPLRVKASTPTEEDGLIWQEFMKGDQRRYQVPCPLCRKPVVFAWSEQFCVMPRLGCEAWIAWDSTAKRADGSWDLDRVARSAHAVCPHCGGDIPDSAKTRMIREGRWVATATATTTRGFRSYHLPSLYAVGTQTSFGALAVAFLRAKKSFLGLRGFVNGALSEPFMRQDMRTQRVEVVVSKPEAKAEASKIMTVDCQHGSPHFWYVVRTWERTEAGTVTTAIRAGHAETWEDLHSIKTAEGVPDAAVMVDSGWGARSDAEVYRRCAAYSEFVFLEERGKHFGTGWCPAKGMPSRKTWKQAGSESQAPYFTRYIDPFAGTSDGGKAEMVLFEFASDWFKDLLSVLRDPEQSKDLGVTWAVAKDVATEQYWQHLDAEYLDQQPSKKTGKTTRTWTKRSQRWPNHLLDCEVMQLAFAMWCGLLPTMPGDS